MDTFELNKIAGAVLFTALIIIGLGALADAIYAPKHPDKPGYMVEVAETGAEPAAKAQDEAVAEVSFASLLITANVDAGQKAAKKCAACHTFDQGGKNKSGPNLFNIVGRKLASESGFSYSAAMKAKAETVDGWSYEALNQFLAKPKTYIPKTKMAFAGIKKAGARADLVAYLRSLSDNPVALPEAQ